jgi:hypothetical protein
MKVADLKRLVKYLNLKGAPTKKDDMIKFIVNQTIGFRLDSDAVYRT